MKNTLTFLVAGFLSLTTMAQVKLPAASTTEYIRQNFGMGTIEITYSRPNTKGRVVFGDLVPWGKLWRTGANNATIIHFSDPVEIGGKLIDTGSYAIYTVPKRNEWEFILNRGVKNWGVDGYKEAEDVIRVKVPSTAVPSKIETFTIQVANVQNESCELQLAWENTSVAVPIVSKIKDRLKAQIEAALLTGKKPYREAATFYFEWEKDLNKAGTYAEKAIETLETAGQKPYWLYLLKARIQKEAGDKKGAKLSADKCVELAKEAGNADYMKMGKELSSSL